MDLKLKPGVSIALFSSLLVVLLTAGSRTVPEGASCGIWRGEVETVTASGAMVSTDHGQMWVSSPVLCNSVLAGDSLLILGRRNRGFISPYSIRMKEWGSPVRGIREAFRCQLETRIDNSRARGLAGGLLMGLRGMITNESAQCFRSSGTSHLLAISGLHTAAAAAAISIACGLFFGKKQISYILAVCGILVFVLISGARASTVRAGIMCTCVLVWMSRKGGRAHMLSFWWIALLVNVFIMPEVISDRGAWMSYGAVLSLILLGRNFRGKAGIIFSPLAAGVTVTVALAPLTTAMYGGFAWLGPVATVISLPMMIAVMLTGILAAAGVPCSQHILTWISTVWHHILSLLSHEPIAVPGGLIWFLWVPALAGLRVFSRWNGFHRRFR